MLGGDPAWTGNRHALASASLAARRRTLLFGIKSAPDI
jgi:hypothetical protein